MQKTSTIKSDKKITVSLRELQGMLNCGRYTAERIAADAGAKIKIGRKTLYHTGKIEKYLDDLAGGQGA